MDNELLYVRFVRGSLSSYKALEVKSDDTLYFVYDEDTGTSALYLGTRLISGNGEIIGANNLDELNDVFLSNLMHQDILYYNTESSQWNNLAFADFINTVKAGLAHLDITVDENVFELDESGALKLIGFEEAEVGAIPTKNEDGSITWTVPEEAIDLSPVEESIAALQSDVDTLKTDVDALETGLLDFSESVDGIKESVTGLTTALESLEEEVGKKANSNDVYTKTETDTKIGEAIAAVDHLERIIVPTINDIDLTAPNAGKFIYMIPTGSVLGEERYDEYMIIDGAIERVGSWDTDLSDYALKSELAEKVDKQEGYSLISDEDIAKLAAIEAGAQVNVIDGVSEEFSIDEENKTLTLAAVPQEKISNLDQHETIKDVYSQITIVQNTVQNVADLLNTTYVTKTLLTEELNKIKSAITWTDL